MDSKPKYPPAYHKAKPTKMPNPTYWPFFLAIGLMLLAWGLIAGWPFALGGGITTIIALTGWINDMRHD